LISFYTKENGTTVTESMFDLTTF